MDVFLDGKPINPYNLPDGPLYIVWSPLGEQPVNHVFTSLDYANKAAKRMAKHRKDEAAVFYVAAFLYNHQYQQGSVSCPMTFNPV